MGIPWVTILLALLSYFMMRKKGATSTKAAITAGLVGAGSYYVSHNTDWGQANLGALDGVAPDGGQTADVDGAAATDENGKPIATGGNASGNAFADVLKSWGATGTSAVIGTTGAAAGTGVFSSKYIPWLIGGVALLVLMK